MIRHRLLTTTAVYEAAETLMQAHGTTTALEVNSHLRRQGYWARQADVSAFMRELARYRDWCYVSNGRYRVYTFIPAEATSTENGFPLFMLN